MSSVQVIRVGADEGDQRLDRWLRRQFPQLNQIAIEKLCRTGQLRVDGGRVKPATRLEPGQEVRVPPLPDAAPPPVPRAGASEADARMIQDAVIWKDEHVIALNKPPGLPSQGGSGQGDRHVDGLAGALMFGFKDKPKLVHRLDKDTSGVLLLARTDRVARRLSESFRARTTRKIYWAAVAGVPQPRMGTIRDGRRGKGSRCYIIGRSDGSATEGCVENRVAGAAAPIPAIHIEDTGATRTSVARSDRDGTGMFDQVPTISPRVPPDDDTPVRLVARKRLERHARGLEALIVAREIVRLQEKPDPSAALLSDGRGLAVSDGPGEQDLGIATRGRNPHPSLAVA